MGTNRVVLCRSDWIKQYETAGVYVSTVCNIPMHIQLGRLVVLPLVDLILFGFAFKKYSFYKTNSGPD